MGYAQPYKPKKVPIREQRGAPEMPSFRVKCLGLGVPKGIPIVFEF